MKFNNKEKRILSIIIASWGIFLIGSGLVMNNSIKPIIKTNYSLKISKKKIAQAQAKTNEIKLKDITIEINTPLSVDVKDYLDDIQNIKDETIKLLKLDTSLVNINQSGTYQYTVTYKKKKYVGNITVKEKELPNVKFTLKNLTLTTGDSISTNPRSYINEEISDEVINNLTLDLSEINNQEQGNYNYYITYKGTKYQGNIYIRDPGPIIITKNNNQSEQQSEQQNTSEQTNNETANQTQ